MEKIINTFFDNLPQNGFFGKTLEDGYVNSKNSDREINSYDSGEEEEEEQEMQNKFFANENGMSNMSFKELIFLKRLDEDYLQDGCSVTMENLISIFKEIFPEEEEENEVKDTSNLKKIKKLVNMKIDFNDPRFGEKILTACVDAEIKDYSEVWISEIFIKYIETNLVESIQIRSISPVSEWVTWNPPKYDGTNYSTNQKNLFYRSKILRSKLWANNAEKMTLRLTKITEDNETCFFERDLASTVLLVTVKDSCKPKSEMETAINECLINHGGNQYDLKKEIFDKINEITKETSKTSDLSTLQFEFRRYDREDWKKTTKLVQTDLDQRIRISFKVTICFRSLSLK